MHCIFSWIVSISVIYCPTCTDISLDIVQERITFEFQLFSIFIAEPHVWGPSMRKQNAICNQRSFGQASSYDTGTSCCVHIWPTKIKAWHFIIWLYVVQYLAKCRVFPQRDTDMDWVASKLNVALNSYYRSTLSSWLVSAAYGNYIHLIDFPPFFRRESTFFEHGYTLKEKNASKRTKFFCYIA